MIKQHVIQARLYADCVLDTAAATLMSVLECVSICYNSLQLLLALQSGLKLQMPR